MNHKTNHSVSSRLPLAQPSALLVFWGLLLPLLTPAAFATPGLEGTFEYAIDAPWRVEPATDADGRVSYGKLPIVVAILDENVIRTDALFGPPTQNGSQSIRPVTGLGRFGQVRVKAIDPSQPKESSSRILAQRSYSLRDLYEVEKTVGSWKTGSSNPNHSLCRVWAGQSTAGFDNLANTSEWHALLWFDIPTNLAPGTDLHLEAEVDLTGDLGLSYAQALANPEPGSRTPANLITLKNSLKVHLGEAPLPRFDQGAWAYGDLHYHSQGSDNEGESGYSYRGVLHAMGSLGIDFLFATDHASDSRQYVDADLVGADLIEWLEGATAGEYDPDVTNYIGDELRDMNLPRFRFLWELLNEGSTAANTEIAKGAGGIPAQVTRSNGLAPQVFLGCEVDTVNEAGESDAARWRDWKPFYEFADFSVSPGNGYFEPEVEFEFPGGSVAETVLRYARLDFVETPFALENDWTIRYGNGLEYSLFNLAGSYLPKKKGAKIRHDNDLLDTFGPRALRILSDYWRGRGGFEGYPIFDVQGINDIEFTRAHLVYFPADPDNKNAFISSRTGDYGGGTRPMIDRRPGQLGLFEEIDQKGFAFLSHSIGPMNPRSQGSNGPDGAPWSEHMYETAWKMPSILGLQFWNENVRSKSEIEERSSLGRETGYQTLGGDFEGIKKYQRTGFLTGKFELFPFHHESNWEHQNKNVTNIAATLHHGSFTWDKILRWGLDTGKTAALDWLPAGEPRKFFMAGGSDAHGDLNYRREGYMRGTSAITDSALASVRNLVRVPSVRITVDPVGTTGTVSEPPTTGGSTTTTGLNLTTTTGTFTSTPTPTGTRTGTTTTFGGTTGTFTEDTGGASVPPPARTLRQQDVLDSLRAGEFCVTDGPILRLAIDTNGNGLIDSEDIPMGGTHNMFSTMPSHDDLALLVEWKSTPEFGAVRKIDLYVGSHHSDKTSEGRTYANRNHGPRENARIPQSNLVAEGSYRDASGRTHGLLSDNYWRVSGGNLRIEFTEDEIAAGTGFGGTRRIVLDLNAFPADGGANRRTVLANLHYVRAFATTYLPPIITIVGDDPAECADDLIDKLVEGDPDAEIHDICADLDIEVTSIVRRGELPARYAFTNPVWIKRGFMDLPEAPQNGELAPEDPTSPGIPTLEIQSQLQFTSISSSLSKTSLTISAPAEGGIMVDWTSVPNWSYAIEHSSDLQRWTRIASKQSTGTTDSFRDTDPTRLAGPRGFYRLGVIEAGSTLETNVGVFQFTPRTTAAP